MKYNIFLSDRLVVACLVLVFVLTGCAGPQLFHQQLSVLDKGLTADQVISKLQLPPLSIHTSNVGSRTFEFHRYLLNNGLDSDSYFLAYEQQRLIYWGYVTEYRRQPDRELNIGLNFVLVKLAGGKRRSASDQMRSPRQSADNWF